MKKNIKLHLYNLNKMYKCLKCSKVFKYESELIRHKNRKIACNAPKKEYKCSICNILFLCPAEQKRHEKTKKHITNYNKYFSIEKRKSNINLEIDKNNKILELENKIKKLEIDKNNKILELENKINNLEIENQYLKNNTKIHKSNEYIYIIHPAQCINMNIYKIGRTKNIINRVKQYPKGSELLFTITCKNSRLIESKILNYLRDNKNYINAKEHGLEYFQCNLENLKCDIQKIINS
jgi:uncharacterized C2H2 Zn-finger protein